MCCFQSHCMLHTAHLALLIVLKNIQTLFPEFFFVSLGVLMNQRKFQHDSLTPQLLSYNFKEKPARRFNLRLIKIRPAPLVCEPPSQTNSLLDEDPNFRKSETLFTKRNIKSQVFVENILTFFFIYPILILRLESFEWRQKPQKQQE